MVKKVFLVSFSALAVFAACRKNERLDWNDSVVPTPENIQGVYAIKGARWGNLNVFDNSFPDANAVRPCDKDDIYRLGPDYSFKVSDIGMVCSPTNNETGTWSLIDSKTLRLNHDFGTIYFFDGSKLVLKYKINGNWLTVSFIKL